MSMKEWKNQWNDIYESLTLIRLEKWGQFDPSPNGFARELNPWIFVTFNIIINYILP